ncbi:MAG: MBL fold metallo-hydrolase [Solirubrobacteraceae bacterium]
MKVQHENPLPREIASGVHWLGQCTGIELEGETLHSYNSSYLVVGEHSCALVEMGLSSDLPVIEAQLDDLLAGAPPLRYLFISHHESPHAGGIGRWLARFPESTACGNVMDLHLVLPEFADRLQPLEPGDELDLGGTQLRVVEAVFRDMPYTRWVFDTRQRVLFTSDGFAYTHLHSERHCGLLGEETLGTIDLEQMTAIFAYAAFHWTQLVDVEPFIARLEEMLKELDVAVVAPTHGLPFSDIGAIMPEIRKGFRLGSSREVVSLLDVAGQAQ